MALACGARDAVALAGQAERAGFDSVWTTEFSWRSATVPMAAIAATTTRITIGSAIAYALGRTPAVLAAEARDIDELSRGRLILGLGSAQPDRVRRWFGADGTDLAAHVGEVVEAVRTLWGIGAAPVRYDGPPCKRERRSHTERVLAAASTPAGPSGGGSTPPWCGSRGRSPTG